MSLGPITIAIDGVGCTLVHVVVGQAGKQGYLHLALVSTPTKSIDCKWTLSCKCLFVLCGLF